MPKRQKIEWSFLCGDMSSNFKEYADQIPIEIATRYVEKNFPKMFKNRAKTNIAMISVLSNQEKVYVYPTDVLFANAGYYNHAELLKKERLKHK